MHELAEHVAETLDIGPGTRVFEVDCGDGAFLYPFHQNGYRVGGSDSEPAAIERAIAAMPDGVFQVGTAAALDPAIPWDVVICRSLGAPRDLSAVALGRRSVREGGLAEADDMRGLVARMFAKATHAIALLNVPEKSHQLLMHALAEVGAKAIQIEGDHLFARV